MKSVSKNSWGSVITLFLFPQLVNRHAPFYVIWPELHPNSAFLIPHQPHLVVCSICSICDSLKCPPTCNPCSHYLPLQMPMWHLTMWESCSMHPHACSLLAQNRATATHLAMFRLPQCPHVALSCTHPPVISAHSHPLTACTGAIWKPQTYSLSMLSSRL